MQQPTNQQTIKTIAFDLTEIGYTGGEYRQVKKWVRHSESELEDLIYQIRSYGYGWLQHQGQGWLEIPAKITIYHRGDGSIDVVVDRNDDEAAAGLDRAIQHID